MFVAILATKQIQKEGHTAWLQLQMQKMNVYKQIYSLVMIESVLLAVSARMAENRTFCRVSAAKRILSSLELAAMNEKTCLIKSKKDIANLVGSYVEANLENLRVRRSERCD